jgi:DNA polymerase-3 subunit gamma/tau
LAESLPADEIQLCYQIALQGRQDLPLAPDAHAGFTMTLLRMLAFRPQDTQSTPSISGGGQSTAKPSRSSARASTAVEPVAKQSQPMNPSGWPEMVAALSLGGAAGQLAHNAELVSRDGDHFCLRLPAAMALLNERKHIDKLQAALSQHVGAPCQIEVVLGQVEGVSPAALAEQAREARQSDAVRAVQADPFVQDLVTLFDATVVDQSIRPLH